ncbi:MAG: 4-(cytidine 5'-diphospho)-2-C-methyl-D-erythritol kinase [Sphingomicrobium sp.]
MTLSDIGYAKLNLALHVRGKLPDGRHRIETIFVFCTDGDVLTATAADSIALEVDGPFASALTDNDDNLVLRAARALQSQGGVRNGAHFRLTKYLPVASGIGGGSADAAAALRLLTSLWNLEPSLSEVIAPSLGSDVPACLLARSCRGTAGGETLNSEDLGLTGLPVLLVNPNVALSTGPVFAAWDGVDRGPLGEWREGRNDLERPATGLVPEIAVVLDWLRSRTGAQFVRMSGSGATCFAMFDRVESRDSAAAAVPSHWWRLASQLR